MAPVLKLKNITRLFGKGCPSCLESTGPDADTNVCSHCGTVVACACVSLDLYHDEILGIMGESGSGKSTLLKTLHFDIAVSSGEIYFENCADINLLTMSPFEKRRIRNFEMGIVYQNPHLGLKMEVSSGGNVAEKLLMAGWKNIDKTRKRSRSLLRETEFPVGRMDEPPKNLSGGEQQRVQIARALSSNPKVLFLDEMTTGLDLSVQARILDMLRSLQKRFHVSMIVVSHDLGVIRLLAQRTAVMKYGRVVELGLTDQILEDPRHPYTQLLVNSEL
ncbi:MAG: ATP-binding cassette domain-containing protein [Syntrophales bacterium]|nr:ATP-binding cassette domain-containing protein [Syntrophales bacterium]